MVAEIIKSQCADVPTIDISPLFGNDQKTKMKVADQIHQSCRGSGFFYASNHGLDVAKLQEITNEFHSKMTDSEKFDLAINAYNPNNPHRRSGYYMAIPGKKAVQSFCYLNPNFTEDHPMIKAKVPLHEVNWWPDPNKHPKFRQFCEGYYRDMVKLSAHLLKGFALALGKEENFFQPYFREKDNLSAVSLIRYPYLKDYPPVKIGPDGTKLSFEDHLDVSLITVLFQSPIANLQVETTGGWKDVPVSAENYLINCGTYMAHITNNYFFAPNHRVKFVNAERLSLPFFVNLSYDSTIEPFHPDGETERKYNNQTISYGEFFGGGLKDLIVKNGQT